MQPKQNHVCPLKVDRQFSYLLRVDVGAWKWFTRINETDERTIVFNQRILWEVEGQMDKYQRVWNVSKEPCSGCRDWREILTWAEEYDQHNQQQEHRCNINWWEVYKRNYLIIKEYGVHPPHTPHMTFLRAYSVWAWGLGSTSKNIPRFGKTFFWGSYESTVKTDLCTLWMRRGHRRCKEVIQVGSLDMSFQIVNAPCDCQA